MQLLVVLLFLISGATGLVYEVAWGKYLSLFFGSTAAAHTVVLAAFMGGLALGNRFFGALADRSERRLALYGVLEFGVALWCVLFPLLVSILSWLYLSLASADTGALSNLALKVLLSVAGILPPAALMGGTLPVLTRYFARQVGTVGRTVALLYFVNSAGAAAGCLVAGFVLIGRLGLDGTMVATALVNAAIGGVCVWLGRHRETADAPATDDSTGESRLPAGRTYAAGAQKAVLALVFVSGCVSMLYELVWIRLLALVMGSSTYSFSIMLFTFIAGIALGALIVSLLSNRIREPLRWFALAELGVCVSLAAMIPFYERLPYWFNVLAAALERKEDLFPLYLFLKTAISFALMVLPTVLIGMTLPLASAVVSSRLAVLGKSVGNVFSVNTLGNVVGTVVSGFVLIPAFGLQWGMETGILLSGLIGAMALGVSQRARARLIWCGAAAATALVVLVLLKTASPRWSTMVLNAGVYRMREAAADSYRAFKERLRSETVLFHHDGPDMSVAAGHAPGGPKHLWLNVNGKTDASTDSDMGTQLLLAHIPLLLKPDAREVFVVGLGSGITVGAALRHPVERCDVAEISDAVVDASHVFDDVNGEPLDDPRTHLHVADAKEFLLLQDRDYDVIISEPSNPWIAGIGNLFSREFFSEVAAHLEPGGLFAQWIHVYEMDDSTLAIALNTLASVFPDVSVWHPQGSDIVLTASKEPLQPPVERIDSLMRARGVAMQLSNRLVRRKITSALSLLSLQVMDSHAFRQRYPGAPPYNTDRRPLLEYRAPCAFFTGERASILELDRRRRPLAQTGLLLSDYTGSQRFPLTDIVELVRVFSAYPTPADQPLLGSLLREYVSRADTADSAGSQATAFVTRRLGETGLDRVLEARARWIERVNDGSMSPAAWRDLLTFESELLKRTTSAFTAAPDTSLYTHAHNRCLMLFPLQKRRYELRKDALWREIGLRSPLSDRETDD